jgi:outer membrane protein TolC
MLTKISLLSILLTSLGATAGLAFAVGEQDSYFLQPLPPLKEVPTKSQEAEQGISQPAAGTVKRVHAKLIIRSLPDHSDDPVAPIHDDELKEKRKAVPESPQNPFPSPPLRISPAPPPTTSSLAADAWKVEFEQAYQKLPLVGSTEVVRDSPPSGGNEPTPSVFETDRFAPQTNNPLIIAATPFHSNPGNDPDSLLTCVPIDDPLWWKSQVIQSLQVTEQTEPVNTHGLVYLALKNSPRIQAISQNPLIREMAVIEADSNFDPVGFVRSGFDDRNDPVGNALVTGGPAFLKDNIWNGDFGLRQKTRTGADVELSQKLGFQNSNSRFFSPQDQGTATLALNVAQPLLRGRGRFVNESQILIAQANAGAAWDTFANELQGELLLVAQAYWRLYYDRSLFLQKKRNVERGEQILAILRGRQELDSLPSQIARAQSAVESRRTELANALRDIRNTETEIRRRIADRDWLAAQQIELIPEEQPTEELTVFPLEDVVKTALENRPEIREALQRAKAAGIQYEIGENELLPELSLLVGGYVSALNGNSGVLHSWADQFSNKPGYNAGVNFEMPYGNRIARSRLSQRQFQLVKIKAEVEETIQQVIADAQIALRKVDSAIETRRSALVAIDAARSDLLQQSRRWELFGLVEGEFADGQSPVILLNQVLDAQERLAAAELIFAQAELEWKVSELALQRAMGTLLLY